MPEGTPSLLEDLRHWAREDRRIVEKILTLIEAARRDPFAGIGKPEPLRKLGSDVWSRRITQQDHPVYRVTDEFGDVLQARYHYRGQSKRLEKRVGSLLPMDFVQPWPDVSD